MLPNISIARVGLVGTQDLGLCASMSRFWSEAEVPSMFDLSQQDVGIIAYGVSPHGNQAIPQNTSAAVSMFISAEIVRPIEAERIRNFWSAECWIL